MKSWIFDFIEIAGFFYDEEHAFITLKSTCEHDKSRIYVVVCKSHTTYKSAEDWDKFKQIGFLWD